MILAEIALASSGGPTRGPCAEEPRGGPRAVGTQGRLGREAPRAPESPHRDDGSTRRNAGMRLTALRPWRPHGVGAPPTPAEAVTQRSMDHGRIDPDNPAAAEAAL